MSRFNLKRLSPTEHEIQSAIVDWANNNHAGIINGEKILIGDYLIKIPNEGKRSPALGQRMKMEGMKKGVSDLFLALPSIYSIFWADPAHGLWIEVKTFKGKVSKEQEEFIRKVSHVGYATSVIRNVDEGIIVIRNYLGIR